MEKPRYISIYKLSRQLGLSVAWLKREAQAGRLPHLKTGQGRMFNAEDVEAELSKRSREVSDA